MIGNESKWIESHPNSIIAIHPYKLDNYELTGRKDPKTYVKLLKDRGVLIDITESGWTDWEENYTWLMGNHPG